MMNCDELAWMLPPFRLLQKKPFGYLLQELRTDAPRPYYLTVRIYGIKAVARKRLEEALEHGIKTL
jgi:hypothetical protein